MLGLKLNHLSDSGSRSITKPDRTFDLNVVPFLAQYIYRKVLFTDSTKLCVIEVIFREI